MNIYKAEQRAITLEAHARQVSRKLPPIRWEVSRFASGDQHVGYLGSYHATVLRLGPNRWTWFPCDYPKHRGYAMRAYGVMSYRCARLFAIAWLKQVGR